MYFVDVSWDAFVIEPSTRVRLDATSLHRRAMGTSLWRVAEGHGRKCMPGQGHGIFDQYPLRCYVRKDY